MKMRRGLRQVVAGVFGVVLAQAGWAATFTVDPRGDFGTNGYEDWPDAVPGDGICATAISFPIVTAVKCTLRAAVMEANALSGADEIRFAAPGSYLLRMPTPATATPSIWQTESTPCASAGDLDIVESLSIIGNAADPTAIVIDGMGQQGTVQDRLFQVVSGPRTCTAGVAGGPYVSPATFSIQGVTLKGGYQPKDNVGGGALSVDASQSSFGPTPVIPVVTIKNVVFQSNFSYVTGGAIANNGGQVTVEDSVFDDSRTPYVPNIGLTAGGQGGFPGGAFIGGGQGGAVAAWSGSTTLRRVVIKGGYAQVGGAIYAQDASGTPTKLLVEDSVIQGSFAFMGAGIFSVARGDWNFGANTLNSHGVILNRVTMETNEAEFSGGAIWQAGTMLISNSTISNNKAWDAIGNPLYNNKGGGVYNSGRVLDIRSSTIAGNEAEEARIANSASSNNSAGGDEIFFDNNNASSGASSQPFRFTIQNSIIGDGPSTIVGDPGAAIDDNCNGPVGYQALITSLGGNLDSGNTCFPPAVAAVAVRALALAVGDKTGAGNAFAGALADNGALATLPGGAVIKTRALAATSPAVAAGTGCPGSDGRGYDRNGGCDAGAFQTNARALAGNAAPMPQDDVFSAQVNSAFTVFVLANDGDPDATDTLTIDAASLPSHVTINPATRPPTQALLYNAGAVETTDTFSYTVRDPAGLTATARVTVYVRNPASNTAPVAVADEFTVLAGEDTALPVLANDTDANPGDTLTVVPGTFLISPSGPRANDPSARVSTDGKSIVFSGTQGGSSYSFSYMAKDNFSGQSAPAIVTVTVNAAPSLDGMSITVPPGGLTSAVLTSKDNETLTFALAIQPSKGCAVVNASTGAFQYTALADETGKDTFAVEASDQLGASTSAVVTVDIAGAPVTPAAPCTVARPVGDGSTGGSTGGGSTGGSTGGGSTGGSTGGGGSTGDGSSGGGSAGGSSSGGASNPPANSEIRTIDGGGGGAFDALWLTLFATLPWLRRRHG